MEKVFQEYKDDDLIVISVNPGESKDIVNSFITQNNYNFMVLLDLDNSVSTMYGIKYIPTSYFIDREGNIAAKEVGALTADEMREKINILH